mgnify:CR=1 FL=1
MSGQVVSYRAALPALAAPDFARNGYRLPGWCDLHEEQHACCLCGDGGWVRMPRDPGDGRVVRAEMRGHGSLPVLVQCWCRADAVRPPFDARSHGVPVRLAGVSIASWGPDNCREVILARNYVVSWPPAKPWLVFLGQAGRGKTGLAAGIVREVYERHGVKGRMTTVEGALARYRATFDDESRVETTDAVKQSHLAAPLLVLDDLGATKATAWAEETVFAVMNSRYEALAPTIVTANEENDGWAALHPRLRSRMLDVSSSVVHRFSGPDRRLAP